MTRPAITQGWLARLPPQWQNGETLRFQSWFLLVPGAAMLALAAVLTLSTLTFVARAVETEGVVARLERRVTSVASGAGDGVRYFPVFAFTTAEGRRMEVVGVVGASPPAWQGGEAVRLLYDPRDPSRVTRADPASLWLWEALSGFTGLMLAGIALAMRALAPLVDRAVDSEAGRA